MKKSVLGKIIGALVGIALLAGLVYLATPPIGYNENYAPDQPIPFDHSLHAGKYQMACQYCHSNVERSNHATVPTGDVCKGCHLVVASDRPYIKRLMKAWENNESIPWVKVHMLPDHAHFNHRRHVQAGVACQTCHGKVQEMAVVRQVKDLSMGWCINCHRKPENNAPINCGTCHY